MSTKLPIETIAVWSTLYNLEHHKRQKQNIKIKTTGYVFYQQYLHKKIKIEKVYANVCPTFYDIMVHTINVPSTWSIPSSQAVYVLGVHKQYFSKPMLTNSFPKPIHTWKIKIQKVYVIVCPRLYINHYYFTRRKKCFMTQYRPHNKRHIQSLGEFQVIQFFNHVCHLCKNNSHLKTKQLLNARSLWKKTWILTLQVPKLCFISLLILVELENYEKWLLRMFTFKKMSNFSNKERLHSISCPCFKESKYRVWHEW